MYSRSRYVSLASDKVLSSSIIDFSTSLTDWNSWISSLSTRYAVEIVPTRGQRRADVTSETVNQGIRNHTILKSRSEFYQGASPVSGIIIQKIAVDVLCTTVISWFELSPNNFSLLNPKLMFSAPLHDCSSNLHFYSGPYRFSLVY